MGTSFLDGRALKECRGLIACVWLALSFISAAASAQAPITEPAVTLRVDARVVEMSAIVTSKDGEPRTDLTKEQFILKQDGKEQSIRYFSKGDELPLTFLVLIDTSGSQQAFLGDEQRACDLFFKTVLGRPSDHAALIEVNAKITARSGLTSSPQELHRALYTLSQDKEAQAATRLNDAIFSLSKEVLAKVKGRKAIILISDGGEAGSLTHTGDAIAEAQAENVPVYAVEYSGWMGIDPTPKAGIGGLAGINRSASERDPGFEYLRKLSDATGGGVYQVGAAFSLEHVFKKIAEKLRSQYEIGFTPPSDTQPNHVHKLELKTTDKALRVEARTGFVWKPQD